MSGSNPNIRTQTCTLAVVGMEVSFSSIHGLDSYERWLYEGDAWDPANPPPASLPQASRPAETNSHRMTDVPALVSWAVRNALQQAGLTESDKLGFIVSLPGSASLPDQYLLPKWIQELGVTGCVEDGNNRVLVLNQWNVSVSGLLSDIQDLLNQNPLGAVVVVGVDWLPVRQGSGPSTNPTPTGGGRIDPAAAVLVVQDIDQAMRSERLIYAKIAAAGSRLEKEGFHSPVPRLSDLMESAMSTAGKKPGDLGFLELAVDPRTPSISSGLDQLAGVFGERDGEKTCAVGLPNPQLKSPGGIESILALIRGALGLSRRVIYGIPAQAFSTHSFSSVPSPFYLPVWSRSWFVDPAHPGRFTGILEISNSDVTSIAILEEVPPASAEAVRVLERSPVLMFPLAGDDTSSLRSCLDQLRARIESGADLTTTSRYWIEDAQAKSSARFAACILGRTPEDSLREIDFARKGMEKISEQPGEWQTPLGSYLTSKPLGAQGQIAFVYPGAFNSYPGIGKDLLYLFPPVFDTFSGITADIGRVLCEMYLYPKSSGSWSDGHLQDLESRLSSDSVTMLTSGSGLAVIYTLILQDVFQVKPGFAFGYSLGESSMMYAFQVWQDGDAGASVLASTPLFQSRLSGPKLAVRDYWQQRTSLSAQIEEVPWANYLLMTDPSSVRDRVRAMYPYVFLTHINAPRQVVIAGEPDHCQDLIKQVNASALRAPFDHVLHCEAMASEFTEIARINSWEVHPVEDVKLYSAGNYEPLVFEKRAIASSIASALTSVLDFPRLVQRVYDDGARIFIEVGAGSNCSKWVSETLKQQEHASFSVNRRGTDDTTSLLRLLARLISHRVPLTLKPLLASTRND